MDDYFILKPPGEDFTVSDYLHSAIPNLKSFKKENSNYTLETPKFFSPKRFKKIYQSNKKFDPVPKGVARIARDADEEVIIEIAAHHLKEKLHTIDLQLYLSILVWEENIFAKTEALNINLRTNIILFEKVFTFIKVNYKTKYRIMVDIFGMPNNIYTEFNKLFDPENKLPKHSR